MILLTGGTGFLGRHILRRLLDAGRKVRVVCRDPGKLDQAMGPGLERVQGDLLDVVSLFEALKGVSGVVHAGALVSFDRWRRDEMLQVNTRGTENLVNACLESGTEKFIHISSISAFDLHSGPVTESSKLKGAKKGTFYGRTKYLAELEVQRGIQEGLNAAILNPAAILGTGDWRSGTPQLFVKVARGLSFYPSGGTGWVAASDVAEAVNRLLSQEIHPGEKYILSSENLSYQKMLGMMAEALGCKAPGYPAPAILMRTIGQLNQIVGWFGIKNSGITPEAVSAALSSHQVDGSLITRKLGLEYTPLTNVLTEMTEAYKKTRN